MATAATRPARPRGPVTARCGPPERAAAGTGRDGDGRGEAPGTLCGQGPGTGYGEGPGAGRGRGRGGGKRRADGGSASVEFLGFLPLLLLVGLAAVHLGLAAFAAQQAGTGARAAARTATLDVPGATPGGAGGAAMTGWVASRAAVDAPRCGGGAGEVTATVTVDVPPLLPGTGFTVTRRATMSCPAEPVGAAR
ncbi:TadE/TadG family type IV pilus assembly protein [Streptomyces triculaminicus]|uniref:TadE/TadG family type IV pilus assembly protein n=1 Tax=Streptomyces triculaminicus TaxID=2816232 RepID=UPI0037CF8499